MEIELLGHKNMSHFKIKRKINNILHKISFILYMDFFYFILMFLEIHLGYNVKVFLHTHTSNNNKYIWKTFILTLRLK